MLRQHSIRPWCVLAVACIAAAGCAPLTEEERAYEEARRIEIERREDLERTLEGSSEESAALALVKDSPSATGEVSTEQWVRQRLEEQRGTVLFPRWQAFRRDVGRYEVRFTYTLMDESGDVHKRGYAWNADLVLKLVQPPRELKADEAGEQSTRYFRRTSRRAPRQTLQVD